MKEAVEQGYKLAETGDIVLLSPACSSFDWYSCFEERGDDFKRCVHMLQEGRTPLMKRVIISGGGTGGHIYQQPITIYKEIMKQNPDARCYMSGTKQGLEATLVPKEGIEFTTIPVQGLQRQLSLGTLVTLGKTALGIVKANAYSL